MEWPLLARVPLESRQTCTEPLGNNRRQAVSKCSGWRQGQGSRRREETLAESPWRLTVIGGDSPGLRAVVRAGRVDADLSSQWLSAFCVPRPFTLGPWLGGGGTFRRFGRARQTSEGVCSPFYKNNFIALCKNAVQHQKVRVKAKAPPHCPLCPLCPHLDSRWLSRLLQALVLGLVTPNAFISVLPPRSCLAEAHMSDV